MIQLDDEQEQLLREILGRFKEDNRIFVLENALRTIQSLVITTRTWRDEERLDVLDKIEEKCKEALQ